MHPPTAQNISTGSNIQTTYNSKDIISLKGISILIPEEAGMESWWTKTYKYTLPIPVLASSYIHCTFNVSMRMALPGILHLSLS